MSFASASTLPPATVQPTGADKPLIGLDLPAMQQLMQEMDQPAYKAQQLHSWVYVKAVRSFDEMTDLGKPLKQKLQQAGYMVGQLTVAEHQISEDGTQKFLFKLQDGQLVESVLMPYQERGTWAVCLSTQVGCAVNCDFCATAKIGFKRNLTPTEIVEQLLWMKHYSTHPIKNVVMMGQGEPMLNVENVIQAIRLINQSAEIGMRNITLSTSGIIPGIKRLAQEKLPLTLALSLHAATNDVRTRIMPINKKYPLEDLMPAIKQYYQATKRRITIEYILLDGVNDNAEDAQLLLQRLHGLRCLINLIPYNPIGPMVGFKRPSGNRIHAFKRALQVGPHMVTVRLERGADIDAACGQLHNRATAAE